MSARRMDAPGSCAVVTGKPFVSLTMIVKNEESDIAGALESARMVCDELIVVDTGSTDRTVEIARAHGAIVHFFTWCDDFAAARNAALQYATGEWILHLDADERVVLTGKDDLRVELARQPEGIGFLRVPVRSPFPEGLGYEVYGARRIFRNDPKIRWHRPIHENIIHLEDDGHHRDGGCAAIVVDHHGYADAALRKARGKNSRNMRLLKKEIARNPDDPSTYLYLALEHGAVGQFPTGLTILRRGISRFRGRIRPDFSGALHCMAMRFALQLNQPKLAVRLGKAAVEDYAFSELCYLLGMAYLAVDDLVQAERYLQLAITLRNRVAEYQFDAGTGSWKALIELGTVAWRQGDHERALDRWRRAVEWAPDQPLTHVALGRGLTAVGKHTEALEPLQKALELAPTMREAHFRLGQALVLCGDRQAAYDHMDALVRTQPHVSEYWQWLGDILYECEEYEACVDVLGRAIERHQDKAAIYMRLGAALRHLGRFQDALNAYALATALDPTSVGARAGLAFAAQAVEWNVPVLAPPPLAYSFRV